MIILGGILLNFILTLLADWYVCRRVLSKWISGKLVCRIYLSVNVLIYLATIVSMVLFKGAPKGVEHYVSATFVWVVWAFAITAAPKYIFVLCSLVGDLINRIANKKSRVAQIVGLVLAVCVFATMLYGTTVGRTSIEVQRQIIVSDKIPKAFDGYRIVQFSDVHLETIIGRDQLLKDMVGQINDLKPDLVINSGDIVNRSYQEVDDNVLAMLSKIESVDGVYSVLGNHDMGFYVRDSVELPRAENVARLVARLVEIDWKWLLDTTVYLRRGADSISLTGVIYPNYYSGNGHVYEMSNADYSHAYDSVSRDTYNISVTHAPQLWDNILTLGYGDLSLAGHVHAMQFKIGSGKYAISPARLLYKRWSGLHSEQGKFLYINDGMGYVLFPMRVGTKPELTMFELRSK